MNTEWLPDPAGRLFLLDAIDLLCRRGQSRDEAIAAIAAWHIANPSKKALFRAPNGAQFSVVDAARWTSPQWRQCISQSGTERVKTRIEPHDLGAPRRSDFTVLGAVFVSPESVGPASVLNGLAPAISDDERWVRLRAQELMPTYPKLEGLVDKVFADWRSAHPGNEALSKSDCTSHVRSARKAAGESQRRNFLARKKAL